MTSVLHVRTCTVPQIGEFLTFTGCHLGYFAQRQRGLLLTTSVTRAALLGFFFFTQLQQLCMIHSSGTFSCTVQTWSWKSTFVLTSVPEAITFHISTLSRFIHT